MAVPAVMPLPRFAVPPGLELTRVSPVDFACLRGKAEVDTPETQSPRSCSGYESSNSAHSPEPTPRRSALKGSRPERASGKQVTFEMASFDVKPLGPPPGLEHSALAEEPSLVQVFAELREKNVDPHCILKLRKVQHLGAQPAKALERHFGRQAGFKRVIVVYSHMKVPARGESVERTKPSGMAFVIFSAPHLAQVALAKGKHQLVDGVKISVDRYQPEDGASADVNTQRCMIVEGAIFAL